MLGVGPDGSERLMTAVSCFGDGEFSEGNRKYEIPPNAPTTIAVPTISLGLRPELLSLGSILPSALPAQRCCSNVKGGAISSG